MECERYEDQEFTDEEERPRDRSHDRLPLVLTKSPRGGHEDVGNEVDEQCQAGDSVQHVEVAVWSPPASGEPAFEAQSVGMPFAERVRFR